MSNNVENPNKHDDHEDDDEEEENKNFEELGLDPRLVRALLKKSIQKPTPIQQHAIPLILQGKDVVARAKTGSGKTFAYLLPMLQKLFGGTGSNGKSNKSAPSVFVLVPTRELSQQVFKEVSSLIELCRAVQLKVVQLTSSMSASDLRSSLAGVPDILICTPACIPKCLSVGALQSKNLTASLEFLVLDEADLLLSYGYEDDIKALTAHIPRRCQCLLMSATSSDDVDKLKKLILHNPFILTLPEVGDMKDDVVPKNVEQFWISCNDRDKLLYILTLLKLELVQKKVLIFTNTIDMGIRLRLFLEKAFLVLGERRASNPFLMTILVDFSRKYINCTFGIKSAVLNSELPQNSRLHILEEFNAGLFDYLIATDDSQTKEKEQANGERKEESKKSKKNAKKALDAEFGVVRGIDFKNVYTVINFDLPENVAGYIHRIGRTGRGYNTGQSISLVSTNEMEVFEEVKTFLGDDGENESKVIAPFPLLTDKSVESLRYRAEDVAKSVTRVAVREARAQDLRNEILNSEKLKAHFEANPKDLDLLKHDKVLSKNPPAPHLRDIPDYLVDPTTEEASKIVKLKKEAMGNTGFARHQGSKKRSRRSKDPLKTFSVEGPKRGRKGGMKRGGEGADNNYRRKKNKL